MAVGAGIEVTWQPFQLGPAFEAQRWETPLFIHLPREEIANADASNRISGQLDQDCTKSLARAAADESKRRLSLTTERIVELGIFAEPSFVTADGGLFLGNAKLEQAVNRALQL